MNTKNRVTKFHYLRIYLLIVIGILYILACTWKKINNDHTSCFKINNSWTSKDNSLSLKIDSVNGIWHYITVEKNGEVPLKLQSFLKGDFLESFNSSETIHWSIKCRGTNIEIYDLDSQIYVELIKDNSL